jgi:hypothetical protein
MSGAWLAGFALGGVACASATQPGVVVEFVSEPSATVGQELAGAQSLVRVEELHWTRSEVELERCPSAYEALSGWIVSQAHAHGTSSPTLMAVPVVVSATAGGLVAMGELTPPAGRYCKVRYRVAPADGDAVGLADVPALVGKSFLLRGEYGRGRGELSAFELASERDFDVTLPIELDLSSEHPSASLRFGCDLERWFLGVDLGALSNDAREDVVLEAFRASLGVVVE